MKGKEKALKESEEEYVFNCANFAINYEGIGNAAA